MMNLYGNDNYFYEEVKEVVVDRFSNIEKAEIVNVDGSTELVMIYSIGDTVRSMSLSLDKYAIQFANGVEFNEIVETVIDDVEVDMIYVSSTSKNLDISCFDKVKSKIMFSCTSLNNKEYLKKIPHLSYLNMAVYFYILIDANNDTIAKMNVSYDLLVRWRKDLNTVMVHAVNNTVSQLPAKVSRLNNIEEDCDYESEFFELGVEQVEPCSLYVLSNSIGVQGAGVFLYPDVLKNISNILDDDILVIPVSVHEVMIARLEDARNTGYLEKVQNILVTANNELSSCDVLSDKAYVYKRSKDKLEIL